MHSANGRYVCAGCAKSAGVCNWRGEFFCPACTGALVRLQRDINELPDANWETVDFKEWAVENERAIVQEWVRP